MKNAEAVEADMGLQTAGAIKFCFRNSSRHANAWTQHFSNIELSEIQDGTSEYRLQFTRLF